MFILFPHRTKEKTSLLFQGLRGRRRRSAHSTKDANPKKKKRRGNLFLYPGAAQCPFCSVSDVLSLCAELRFFLSWCSSVRHFTPYAPPPVLFWQSIWSFWTVTHFAIQSSILLDSPIFVIFSSLISIRLIYSWVWKGGGHAKSPPRGKEIILFHFQRFKFLKLFPQSRKGKTKTAGIGIHKKNGRKTVSTESKRKNSLRLWVKRKFQVARELCFYFLYISTLKTKNYGQPISKNVARMAPNLLKQKLC